MRPIANVIAALLCWTGAAGAQELRRATVWDLELGQPISAQPSPNEFRGFACGSNGGPPRQRLAGWSDFARCAAEPGGLHEVYFEYDDELEYIARAKDLDREVARWAGTTEFAFPVIVSALFDDKGVLKGIRVVTDSRPDHRDDTTDADLRRREDAYLFGGRMASRFAIDAKRDCTALPPAEGESAVGDAVHQAVLRARGCRAQPEGHAADQLLPQARPERLQSADGDAIDARPVRELGPGGGAGYQGQ